MLARAGMCVLGLFNYSFLVLYLVSCFVSHKRFHRKYTSFPKEKRETNDLHCLAPIYESFSLKQNTDFGETSRQDS